MPGNYKKITHDNRGEGHLPDIGLDIKKSSYSNKKSAVGCAISYCNREVRLCDETVFY